MGGVSEKPERFAWRRKLREHPRYRLPYRIAVGVMGVLMLIAAILTGPFPGPGGIPLFLLGLAVLASEFHWAHRLYQFAERYVNIYRGWPLKFRRLFWVCFVIAVLAMWWIGMIIVGVPDWVPESIHRVLRYLPGVK